jgi:uncharacterized protein (TIGR02246 family)
MILLCSFMPDPHDGLRGFAARYTAAWCSKTPENVAAFFASDASLAINGQPPAVGRAAITAVARDFMTAFPDLEVLFDDLNLLDDHVEYHWTLRGTHATTHYPVQVSGFEVWRFAEDGLIAESQGQFDAADYQRQVEGR